MKRDPNMRAYRSTLLCSLLALTLSGCANLGSMTSPAPGLDKEGREALKLAHTLRDAQRLQAAHGIYARMDERHQLTGSYLLEYASVASAVRPPREALGLLERARLSLGGDLQALPEAQRLALCNGLGRARLALGQSGQAEADFRCAVQAEPRNLQALNGLGVALNLQGKPEQAREQFEAALQIDPGFTPALNNLALAWLAAGDSSRAIGLLNQARGLGDISLQLNLALAYVLAGHDDTARNVLLESIEPVQAESILNGFRSAQSRVSAGAPLTSELLAASQQPLKLLEE